MKNLFLSLFIFLNISLKFEAKSQSFNYHPFPVNTGFWSYRFYNGMGAATSLFNEYAVNGDTTINTTTYKKIAKNALYAGAMRESNRIVYFIPDTSNSEIVLYNFNLQVGDNIINPYGGTQCHGDTVTVVSRDTVLVPAGDYHIAISLSSGASWFDGIGSSFYLLFPAAESCVSGNDQLQCMVGDFGLMTAYTPLPCLTSVNENSSNNDHSFFSPNPLCEASILRVPADFTNSEIKIYTVSAKIHTQFHITNSFTKIARKDFESGFYFYQITNKEGKIECGKFIVY